MNSKVIQLAPRQSRAQNKPEVRSEFEALQQEEPIMAQPFSESVGRSRRDIWEAFLNDRELLDRYHVTEEELGALKTFAPFGTLTGTDDIIYILERIRRSRRRW